jgi:hypothetical protein
MGRFDYVEWDEYSEKVSGDFKTAYEAIEVMLNEFLDSSRELSLALTKLDESFMWVGKAIRTDQLTRQAEGQEK